MRPGTASPCLQVSLDSASAGEAGLGAARTSRHTGTGEGAGA